MEAVALKEQWPKQLVQHLSLLFGDRGMHIHYIVNSLCYIQRTEGLTLLYMQARSRKAASGEELFLTNEWAVVFERIAETAIPVHTRAACAGRIIPVEARTLKEWWPTQLVQHTCGCVSIAWPIALNACDYLYGKAAVLHRWVEAP